MKMILRGWFRSPLSSSISLLSLSIGLLCSTILLLFAITEFRMAKSLGNDPNVYFLEQSAYYLAESNAFSPMIEKELVAAIADNYPEVIEWTVIGSHYYWKWQYDEDIDEEGPCTISVTPAFTKFVTIPMEEGCLDSVLAHPNAIAITRSYANQIFPGENPIGKTISGEQLDGYWTDDGEMFVETKTLVVEGIIDDKFHSFLSLRAIFPRSEEHVHSLPNEDEFYALIKLQKDVLPDDFIKKIAADSILSKKYDTNIRLCKLSDAYFGLQYSWGALKLRDKNPLVIGFSVALIVLVISAFNYLNITLIRAPRRLKNLAGQRIMGANKWKIAGQIIMETALHVLVAFGLALLFMPSAMQLFNSFMSSNLVLQNVIQFDNLFYVITLLGVLILIPAIYLITKFTIKKPMEVFKNPTGNKLQYLGSLVILQMVISMGLIAFSINVKRQMDFIANSIPQAQHIICIEDYDLGLSKDFIDHVTQSASTTEYLFGNQYPDRKFTNDNGEVITFKHTQPNFFEFLRIPILFGRVFDSIPTDIPQVVANKAFIKSKGISDNLVGYQFSIDENKKEFRIVGVCEDFNLSNATLNVPPIIYVFGNEHSKWRINIRFHGSLENKINEIKDIFEKCAKNDEYADAPLPRISTLADNYIAFNPEVNRLRIMVTFFAFISIFLSAIGLFGLSWYSVERRRKEIALRKVHGASTGTLLLLLCKTFFIWCAIATIIALPIGYYISQYWLQRFAYRIDNSILTLLLTALIAATVTFLTVIFQTTRAAMTNPARFIKND